MKVGTSDHNRDSDDVKLEWFLVPGEKHKLSLSLQERVVPDTELSPFDRFVADVFQSTWIWT